MKLYSHTEDKNERHEIKNGEGKRMGEVVFDHYAKAWFGHRKNQDRQGYYSFNNAAQYVLGYNVKGAITWDCKLQAC